MAIGGKPVTDASEGAVKDQEQQKERQGDASRANGGAPASAASRGQARSSGDSR